MKKAFEETLKAFASQMQASATPVPSTSCFLSPQVPLVNPEDQEHSASDAASSEEEYGQNDGFDFASVQPFVKEIRQALLWEDVV